MAPEAIAALMLGEEAKAVRAAQARAEVIGRAARLVADGWRPGGRLVYVGAGTSGRLGTLDAVECVPTFGVPPSRLVPIIAGGPSALTRSVEGAEDNVRDGRAAAAARGGRPGRRRLLHRRVGDDAVRPRRARVRALPRAPRDHLRDLRRHRDERRARRRRGHRARHRPRGDRRVDPAQGGNGDQDGR